MIIIETPRLLFRPLTLEDVDDLTALYSDLEVMRFFEGTRSHQQAREEIEECQKWYSSLGFYFWVTIHKADNRFIGRCGLLPQVIDERQEVEVAYMIARPLLEPGVGNRSGAWHQGVRF